MLLKFLRLMAEKEKQKAKLDILVQVAAAAAQPRPMKTRWQLQEEEEEEDPIMAKDFNFKTTSALHNHKCMPETDATSDMAQPHGSDGATMSCVIEVASDSESEPIQEDEVQFEDSMSGSFKRARACHIQGPSDLASCWQTSQMPLEESEESSSSCKTLSDNDETDLVCPSSKTMQHESCNLNDIVASMIKDLCSGKVHNEMDTCFALDNMMGCLQDCATLHAA